MSRDVRRRFVLVKARVPRVQQGRGIAYRSDMKKRPTAFTLVVGSLIALLFVALLWVGWSQERWLGGYADAERSRLRTELDRDLECFRRRFDDTFLGARDDMRNAILAFLRGDTVSWKQLGLDPDTIWNVAFGIDNAGPRWARNFPNSPRPDRDWSAIKDWIPIGRAGHRTGSMDRWGDDRLRQIPLPPGGFRLRPIGVGERLALEATIAARMSFHRGWKSWADPEVRDYEVTVSVLLDPRQAEPWVGDLLRECLGDRFDAFEYLLEWEWEKGQTEHIRSRVFATNLPFFWRLTPEAHFDAEVDLLRTIDLPDNLVIDHQLVDVPGASVPARSVVSLELVPDDAVPRWTLRVRHRSGSLETHVASLHRRDRGVAGLGLLLVGIAGLLLVLVAVRSRRLARMQGDFASSISHELRSPLAVIHSAAVNLSDGTVADPPRAAEYGRMIRGESTRLRDLVERVLTLARLRSDARSLEAVEIRPVAEAALASLAPDIEKRGIDVSVVLGVPPAVCAEPVALEAAIHNLIDNAIKHGGSGGRIAIEADCRRRLGREWVVLSVRDWGPGIDRSDHRRIFQPFFRGRRARERQVPGTGLGLDLASRVAKAFGGRIIAERREDGMAMHLWLEAVPEDDRA